MITHIQGTLIEKTPTYVVIDVNGVGYKIKISLQTFSAIEGELCKLFTHLSVKEDSHTLFGFFEESERHLFRNLISVSGVGPSTAQVILSTFSPDEIIQHITTADVAAVQSVKGIGAKTAQRIIIDLKDKIHIESSLELDSSNQHPTIRQETLYALEKLGFSIKKMKPIVDKITYENEDLSVEEVIKIALKTL